jgi:uncharacterized membrane protein YfcA
MCPICWISGIIAVLFGGSFVATVNHPISWVVGALVIAYGVYKFYDGYKRGKTMKDDTKVRNKKTVYRFVQGLVIGSLVTGVLFYKFTADEHQRMHNLLDESGITLKMHDHEMNH